MVVITAAAAPGASCTWARSLRHRHSTPISLDDFILIEHDIEFDTDAIEILEQCPEGACTVAGYLRLARFRAELMRAFPDAFEGLPTRNAIGFRWSGRHEPGSSVEVPGSAVMLGRRRCRTRPGA